MGFFFVKLSNSFIFFSGAKTIIEQQRSSPECKKLVSTREVTTTLNSFYYKRITRHLGNRLYFSVADENVKCQKTSLFNLKGNIYESSTRYVNI